MKKSKKTPINKTGVDRRAFVKLLPAVGVAGLAAAKLPLDVLAQTPTPTPTPVPSPVHPPLRRYASPKK